jgi:hypothetical protein
MILFVMAGRIFEHRLFHGHINLYGQFALDLDRPSFPEAA